MRLVGFGNRRRKSVLYAGQFYYNNWYLSRALRKLGWKADVMNWDLNPEAQIFYHGEDFRVRIQTIPQLVSFLPRFFKLLWIYDVFHFGNMGGLQFGDLIRYTCKIFFGEEGVEIRFLKALGKKIIYSNNGCMDGVSQTAFSRWGPESPCSTCRWQHESSVCSDDKNLAWGKFRNEVSDYQCLLGGNKVDYNDDARVHEVPEFYCLEKDFWHPDIEIPEHYYLPTYGQDVIHLYHAVGNKKERTRDDGANIKSSHIYFPLVERLKSQGYSLELIAPTGIPNKEVRYLQAQADIVLDMLTFGWFGANAREAMMLGKPIICFLRPEWLESAHREIPDYVDELPIISATPDTVEDILLELINNKQKRIEVGRRSREFAVKWHSAEAGAQRLDQIYGELLGFGK